MPITGGSSRCTTAGPCCPGTAVIVRRSSPRTVCQSAQWSSPVAAPNPHFRSFSAAFSVVTTGKAAETLRKWGFTAATGLDTWAAWETERDTERLRVTAVPGRHGPAVVHRLLPPVIGTVLDLETRTDAGWRRDLRVYITGDTLNVPELRGITERFPDVDVMVTHLGGTRALGVLVTMDGRQGTDLVERVRPGAVVPVHYDDYTVMRSPLSDFVGEMGRRGHAALLHTVGRGDTVDLFPTVHAG